MFVKIFCIFNHYLSLANKNNVPIRADNKLLTIKSIIMKRIFLYFLLVLTFGITSCDDNTQTENAINPNILSNGMLKSVSTDSNHAAFLGLALHRAIHTNPRTGLICNCKACFGVCRVEKIGCPDTKSAILIPDPDTNTGILYIIEDVSNYETEFGIDGDFAIPDSIVAETDYNSVTFRDGLYSYYVEEDCITVDSQDYTYYGWVEVNLNIE